MVLAPVAQLGFASAPGVNHISASCIRSLDRYLDPNQVVSERGRFNILPITHKSCGRVNRSRLGSWSRLRRGALVHCCKEDAGNNQHGSESQSQEERQPGFFCRFVGDCRLRSRQLYRDRSVNCLGLFRRVDVDIALEGADEQGYIGIPAGVRDFDAVAVSQILQVVRKLLCERHLGAMH